MNKKAGQRILIFYWIIIMIIILIGIVSGVLHIFGSNIDVRRAEAGLLRDNLVSCLIEQGKLKTEIYESENLLEKCKIKINDEYAIKLKLKNEKEKKFGKESLFIGCDNLDNKFPRCIQTTIYILKQDKSAYLEITTVVDKNEKNI